MVKVSITEGWLNGVNCLFAFLLARHYIALLDAMQPAWSWTLVNQILWAIGWWLWGLHCLRAYLLGGRNVKVIVTRAPKEGQ
jgi:hypothetical protein